MKDATAQPELLTVDDFAALLQVSTRQIYLMEGDGRLGPVRVQIGRAVRFRRREVEDWIAAGCPLRRRWHREREINPSNEPTGFVCKECRAFTPWKELGAFDPVKVCTTCAEIGCGAKKEQGSESG